MTNHVRQKHHLLQNMTVYVSETPVFREREKAFRFHTESRRSIKKGIKVPFLQGKKKVMIRASWLKQIDQNRRLFHLHSHERVALLQHARLPIFFSFARCSRGPGLGLDCVFLNMQGADVFPP